MDRHICPGQFSQQLVEARPGSTMDLKVPRVCASESLRNQEHVSYMEISFQS